MSPLERRGEAFLSHAELRSLTPENLEGVAAKRDRYEQIFRDLLTEGASAGAFHPDDVKLAARAILAMCVLVLGGRVDEPGRHRRPLRRHGPPAGPARMTGAVRTARSG